VRVLDKGEVEIKTMMGGDFSVIAAARVSNGATFEEASKGPEADQKLINYLVKHRHGTPFEHAAFTFYVKTPLFVRSEWHRHRIASYNEISGRYVEYEPEFYIPSVFRIAAQTNKQGSVIPENKLQEWHDKNREIIEHVSEIAFYNYKRMLKENVAKEMARMILPLNLYTQFYFTVNARSLMNFLSLRCAEDAQYEIRQYALAIEKMFAQQMPMTYKAWAKNEFVAP
jgi:thymidylate synthase (FAD)